MIRKVAILLVWITAIATVLALQLKADAMSERFAYVMEFDRDTGEGGTPEQQAAILEHVRSRLVFDCNLDRTFRALARVVKKYWQDPGNLKKPVITHLIPGVNGLASDTDIWVNHTYTGEALLSIWTHELGHVIGINLFNPQERSEQWAEEFKIWVFNGCPSDHPVWERLEVQVNRILGS